jgi:hypothetical protein
MESNRNPKVREPGAERRQAITEAINVINAERRR